MAKKKPAKKASKRPPARPARKKAKAAPRKPKAQRLPEMDIPKIRSLDRICESIADVRESKNEAAKEEKGLLQNALREMQKHSQQVYKAHGVELVWVHGDDKVRVRLIDDDSSGEDEPVPGKGEEHVDALDEPGPGAEANE